MTTCDVLELKLVTPNNAKLVKNFVREVFVESEPINQYLIRKECKNFRYFDKASSIGDCIDEGLSYMFVTKCGQIVAIALVQSKKNEHPVEHVTHPIFLKLIPFFLMVEDKAKEFENEIEIEKEACFWILSVHPDWRGKRLAKSLVTKVKSSLNTHGFTHISSCCTGAYSTKLLETFGFEKLFSIKYADYTSNGEVVFLPDEPHTHLNYMRLKL